MRNVLFLLFGMESWPCCKSKELQVDLLSFFASVSVPTLSASGRTGALHARLTPDFHSLLALDAWVTPEAFKHKLCYFFFLDYLQWASLTHTIQSTIFQSTLLILGGSFSYFLYVSYLLIYFKCRCPDTSSTPFI